MHCNRTPPQIEGDFVVPKFSILFALRIQSVRGTFFFSTYVRRSHMYRMKKEVLLNK